MNRDGQRGSVRYDLRQDYNLSEFRLMTAALARWTLWSMLGLMSCSLASYAKPMEFKLEETDLRGLDMGFKQLIYASGELDRGTTNRFRAFLARNPPSSLSDLRPPEAHVRIVTSIRSLPGCRQ